LTEMC